MKARAKAALRRGRRAAEALMVDRCDVKRPDGNTTDPDTGEVTPVYQIMHTDYPCKVKGTADGHTPSSGEHRYMLERPQVHLPIDAEARINDVVVITASAEDPRLVGLEARLREPWRGSLRTAQRWNVEVLSG